MPNTVATLMLLIWPFVTAAFYMQLPVQRALILSVVTAYLMLPMAELALPVGPGLSKYMIPAFFGYIFACMTQGRLISLIPQSRLARFCLLMFFVSIFGTTLTNSDPIFVGQGRVLPGLSMYDAASLIIHNLGWLIIWALGREFLNDREGVLLLARSLVYAMLIYSLPMLYEIRMSPQLHSMIYGFFQHSFAQMMRQGGFRPIVFLEHGLWLAMLTAMAALTALVLARAAEPAQKTRWYQIALYFGVLLVLCKSMASLIYVVVLAPVVLFMRARTILRVALLLTAVIISFPVMRSSGWIPTEWLVELAANYSIDRSQSLQFRFDNEDGFLGRVAERPLFGWGGWGRNAVYDPLTGETHSVADGQWIIIMGIYGYAGFIGFFGMLLTPVLIMGHAFRRAGRELSLPAAGMALVLVVNLLDLLPNATLSPITWLLAGGLLGYLERLGQAEDDAAPSAVISARPSGRRFAGLVGDSLSTGPRSLL